MLANGLLVPQVVNPAPFLPVGRVLLKLPLPASLVVPLPLLPELPTLIMFGYTMEFYGLVSGARG